MTQPGRGSGCLLGQRFLTLTFFCQVEELKETVKDEFMPWVSQYLVMKRVSIEPNFHSLYSNFLDTLKNPEFVKMVLTETYRNIKVRCLTAPLSEKSCSDVWLLA